MNQPLKQSVSDRTLPHLLATVLGCVKDPLVLTTVNQKWIFCTAALLIKLDMMRAEELPGLKNCWLLSPPLFAPSPPPPCSIPSLHPSLYPSFLWVSLVMLLIKQRDRQGLIKISSPLSLSPYLLLFISPSPSSSDVIMAARCGRSLHGKIILSNLLPLQLFKERDLHFQPDQRENRKMGLKTEKKKCRGKTRGGVKEMGKKTGRREADRRGEERQLQREYVKEERRMSGCSSGCSRWVNRTWDQWCCQARKCQTAKQAGTAQREELLS